MRLNDVVLDIEFEQDARPILEKPRTFSFSLMERIDVALDEVVQNGIWEEVHFNKWGTPIVPLVKSEKASFRICGDYSVKVNPVLKNHRQPIPKVDELISYLNGSYYFSRIDSANAYNQICLTPQSSSRLALSTNRGVFLQNRLPFRIKSAPEYFQELMSKLTADLKGVAVYFDDILVSGKNYFNDNLSNRKLVKRLEEN
ncbi:Retrovirus-related Pol polyprotein from transposon 17.6 [Thelohanellus kitauei]|uniref:Retrovirus-related Pol polyprotein from transposon 17.6 n=1 Tax=Thelohanellus kitauei TaxID=669202 RepID=A0A0C2N686_THEKT|nr:Retrovirus-related Pol polyprotein from transposon 17.6 [Thelohanellus kitauei]